MVIVVVPCPDRVVGSPSEWPTFMAYRGDPNHLLTIPGSPMLQAMTRRKALKKLWLRENQLSGEIPKELGGEHGGLSNLQELYLSNNQLRTLGKKMSGEGDKNTWYWW